MKKLLSLLCLSMLVLAPGCGWGCGSCKTPCRTSSCGTSSCSSCPSDSSSYRSEPVEVEEVVVVKKAKKVAGTKKSTGMKKAKKAAPVMEEEGDSY